MNDLDAARAIATGDLPSPFPFGNAALFALRISGTGMAERPDRGESVYRDPAVWLGNEMRLRVLGLPVVIEHPAGGLLNDESYAGSVIGSIVHSYVKDNELWGVARVMDQQAALAMASRDFSTSPSAAFSAGTNSSSPGAKNTLLVEGNPQLLDHLAVIPNGRGADGSAVDGGVWGKLKPPSGIRNDYLKETTMADEENKPEGEDKLDKVLAALGGLSTMCESLGKRMDAFEAKSKDDDTSTSAVTDKRGTRADAHDSTVPPEMPDVYSDRYRAAVADVQMRYDEVMRTGGQSAPAPLSGETRLAYRKRLLRGLMGFSPRFKDVDLNKITEESEVFDGMEKTVLADAYAVGARPPVPRNELREIVKTDAAGRRIVEFEGSPRAWMAPFRAPVRRVVKFNKDA